jgi:hypothetical protein
LEQHRTHPALYQLRRLNNNNENTPRILTVLYVYDQYRIACPPRNGKAYLPNKRFPAIFLALIVESFNWNEDVGKANFDGGCTYFACHTFSYGSNPHHWKGLQDRALADGKFFIPSVGLG